VNWSEILVWTPVVLAWVAILVGVGLFYLVIVPYDKKYAAEALESAKEMQKLAEERAIWIHKQNIQTVKKLERILGGGAGHGSEEN
jgi:hypothetical protein